MEPKELANNFVRQFDKLNNKDKSVCLNEIAHIFSCKYDVTVFCEWVVNNKHDCFYLPLFDSDVGFEWNVYQND